MKPDKKIIQQLTDDYFNNHKNWFFENLEALEYKEQFILQEIDRTDSAIKDLEKHLQNPDLRSDDNISYLQGGYKYLEFLKKEYQKHLPPQQNETKTPTAPAIALFCNLINEAEIIKKESDEIPETYCKRICENYKLKYTDRVRQNFNGNKSKKHYKELTELILPCIDVTIKDKIQKYLDSKNPPKQKLYA